MIVTRKMQDPVQQQFLDHLPKRAPTPPGQSQRRLHGYHHIAEHPVRKRTERTFVQRERENVRGTIPATVAPIEPAHFFVSDKRDTEGAAPQTERSQDPSGTNAGVVRYLMSRFVSAGDRNQIHASDTGSSPLEAPAHGRPRSLLRRRAHLGTAGAPRPLGLFVGRYDILHQPVSDHVTLAKSDESDPLYPLQDLGRLAKP